MKTRSMVASGVGGVLTLAAILISGSTAFAQQDRVPPFSPAVMAGMLVPLMLFGLAFYAYLSLALQTIATKTNTENAWLAWIPIANVFLMLTIAKKPLWWFILFLIPLVSIVIAILVWMGVAEARGKPNWWGILLIVPVVGLIVPGYLAWSD
jgi:hypothetical protein